MPLSIVYLQEFVFNCVFLLGKCFLLAGILLSFKFLNVYFLTQKIFDIIRAFGLSFHMLAVLFAHVQDVSVFIAAPDALPRFHPVHMFFITNKPII